MRYALSDDQSMIQDAVRRFATAEVQPHAYDWDGAASAPASALASLAELGLMGMRASENVGGAGLDPIAALLAVETLAAADGGLAWTVGLHNLVALPALEAARHPSVCTLATGEGVAGWFDGRVRVELGDAATVTGNAALVAWGGQATVLVGQAKGPAGPVLVAVEADADSVRTSAADGVMGLRSAAMATVRFESTPAYVLDVPPARVQAWFRLAQAAVAVGVGTGALTASTCYAQEREQFKKPIAQFQGVQWMLADAATELEAARLLTWSAVGPDGAASVAAASRARLFALPTASRAGMRAVQVYGGNGYVREYPVERCLRDAKALEVLRPVDDDHEAIVGAVL